MISFLKYAAENPVWQNRFLSTGKSIQNPFIEKEVKMSKEEYLLTNHVFPTNNVCGNHVFLTNRCFLNKN